MKILKFGGSSLTNENGLKNTIEIIQKQSQLGSIAVVVSARGDATDTLENMLIKAKNGKNYAHDLSVFKRYQLAPNIGLDLFHEFELLKNTLEAVSTLRDYSPSVKDLVLAQGEVLSVKVLTALLQKKGIEAQAVQATQLLITENKDGIHHVQEKISQEKTAKYFKQKPSTTIPIITGFIASDQTSGQVTTLGRNGSNYSASLIAKFTNADEVLSYTNVDGVYTANPAQVADAVSIKNLTYQEAHELANFGASILHEKTIAPLAEASIPLRILNTFNSQFKGTVVGSIHQSSGVKSISVQQKVSLIQIEGAGLLGKVGIDARIFNALETQNVSIGVISQGSSERGVSFIVDQEDIEKSIGALNEAFKYELEHEDIDVITATSNIGVITIIGQNVNQFHTSLKSLAHNNIEILLINNTSNGHNISVVIQDQNIDKAVHLIHAQIFGVAKRINIAIFGKGTVGSSLIDQIVRSQKKIAQRKGIQLHIFAIAGSSQVLLQKNGIDSNWKIDFKQAPKNNTAVDQIIEFARANHFENLIAIDNTASSEFIQQYIPLIENGFDLISSNKLANTERFDYYNELRHALKLHSKNYLYETNVGAGLPLIDTIKLLHDSGENITRIKGIFSGSLSFLFNQFSERNEDFSSILKEAIELGYTEPDPREDLCGNDVARKLLILARELDLENEFEDIEIQNLVPELLQDLNQKDFLDHLDQFDSKYLNIKNNQPEDHVLRYVGDLYGDLQQNKGQLKVELVSVPKSSALGQVSGSDSIIEIYTESYGDRPIVIQGAGAGAEVTARGVFGDLLRISDKK
jgi:aspartate kinase